MYPPTPTPPRIPQRVITAGPTGPATTALLERLAAILDVPFIALGELSGPGEAAELAAFEGWVTTSEHDDARALLLDRADLVVHLTPDEPGTLRGLVRRTVRKMRADGSVPDVSWLETLPLTHPDLPVALLAGPTATEAWLAALSA